jgi:hypothetical protein
VTYQDVDGWAMDCPAAEAYEEIEDAIEPDYVSGAGSTVMLPTIGYQVPLPLSAVIDLETAELLHFADGNCSGPSAGAMAAIQAANND